MTVRPGQPPDPSAGYPRDDHGGLGALLLRLPRSGDTDVQAAAWAVPHSCQNELVYTVTSGHSGDVQAS
jgi:hypothetical protein